MNNKVQGIPRGIPLSFRELLDRRTWEVVPTEKSLLNMERSYPQKSSGERYRLGQLDTFLDCYMRLNASAKMMPTERREAQGALLLRRLREVR